MARRDVLSTNAEDNRLRKIWFGVAAMALAASGSIAVAETALDPAAVCKA
jgi:hypothetical protein